jgi:predicted AlkP superfamily pyrophosphatase or phosphodiesterase
MRRRWIAWMSLSISSVTPAFAAPVLLISIDGLHPRYVLEAQKLEVDVPNLRSFVTGGAHASGVVGVVPTVTYPSHTTIVTGATPVEHGIAANVPFDPLARNHDGWYWYAEDLRVPTLWDAVHATGLSTASVNWPVTVGEREIDVLLPEFWRAENAEDLKLIRALSRPDGALEKLEAKLGPFVDGYTDTVESDEIRTRFALAVLREHRPAFMAVHLIALDGTEHRDGPFVDSAYRTLEAIDRMIGELAAAALANDPGAVVVIVSDHGFIATHTAVNLRAPLVAAGLIKIKQPVAADTVPVIESWDVQLWNGGAVAGVMLRDPSDAGVRARALKLLDELRAEPANGIARVLSGAELAHSGGFPGADFLVEFAPGFYLGTALRGPLLTAGGSKGTHGYLPARLEMHAAFFAKGRGVAAGRALGVVDMRQIAPTLAKLLGVELPSARERALELR